MVRKLFVLIFTSLSIFFVSSCFIRKAYNKEPLTLSYTLKRVKTISYDIKFSFSDTITEYKSGFEKFTLSECNNAWDVVVKFVRVIGKNIYNVCKLVIMLFVDTIRSGIVIIVGIGDIIGLCDYNDIYSTGSGGRGY